MKKYKKDFNKMMGEPMKQIESMIEKIKQSKKSQFLIDLEKKEKYMNDYMRRKV